MKEGFLESRGIAYRATRIDPNRTTLLFVHGLSGSLSAWYAYEESLAKNYNVITFDLRGHGLSQRPNRFKEYAIEESVEDITALVLALGVRAPVVVSHSYGTTIAMEYVRSHHCAGAIFVSPAYSAHSLLLAHLMWPLIVLGSVVASIFPTRRGARTDYTRYTPAGDWSVNRIAADIWHMGVRSYLWSLRQLLTHDRNRHWQRITAPTLLVHGTKDSIVPIRYARALVQIIPQATLTEIAGGNHIIPLNNPAELMSAIEQFTR